VLLDLVVGGAVREADERSSPTMVVDWSLSSTATKPLSRMMFGERRRSSRASSSASRRVGSSRPVRMNMPPDSSSSISRPSSRAMVPTWRRPARSWARTPTRFAWKASFTGARSTP
jgi:hypothetical protein